MVAEPIELAPRPRRFRAAERLQKRRDWFIGRIGNARSGGEKVSAAAGYVTGMLADPRVDRTAADTTADHVARVLMDAGDSLAKTVRRRS